MQLRTFFCRAIFLFTDGVERNRDEQRGNDHIILHIPVGFKQMSFMNFAFETPVTRCNTKMPL